MRSRPLSYAHSNHAKIPFYVRYVSRNKYFIFLIMPITFKSFKRLSSLIMLNERNSSWRRVLLTAKLLSLSIVSFILSKLLQLRKIFYKWESFLCRLPINMNKFIYLVLKSKYKSSINKSIVLKECFENMSSKKINNNQFSIYSFQIISLINKMIKVYKV